MKLICFAVFAMEKEKLALQSDPFKTARGVFKRPQSKLSFDGDGGIFKPRPYTDLMPMNGFIRHLKSEGVSEEFINSLAQHGQEYIKCFGDEIDDFISREDFTKMLKTSPKKKVDSPAVKQAKLHKLEENRKKRSEELGIGKVTLQEKLVSAFSIICFFILSLI